MSDNLLKTIQQFIQDNLAPDVRETKTRLSELEKRMDMGFASMQKQMDSQNRALLAQMESQSRALQGQMDANQRAIVSAIGELKAQSELVALRAVSDLRERVAVLESRQTDSSSRAA